jgi:hypothetical protein
MKALMLAFVTAGALSFGLLSTAASAQQIHLGVNVGNGNGYGNQWNHGRHRHNHCRMVKTWRHHHPVWVQQCG